MSCFTFWDHLFVQKHSSCHHQNMQSWGNTVWKSLVNIKYLLCNLIHVLYNVPNMYENVTILTILQLIQELFSLFLLKAVDSIVVLKIVNITHN